jgi:serine/threonine-protein kinase
MTFITRGPLTQAESALYVVRPCDQELLQLAQRMDYVALIGPRWSGKTSLLMRLWATLQPMPRFALAYINLSLYQSLQGERWLTAVYQELVASTAGLLPAPLPDVTDTVELREALLQHLRQDIPERSLIVLLDDVESVPMEERTPFFSALREMFVSRGIHPSLRRLTFVLAGSYIPDELIPDATTSPFRVAEKLYVDDAPDLGMLIQHLERPGRRLSLDTPTRIQEWTEGDLYLTQRLCERLDQRYPDGLISPQAVDQVVERYLLDDDLVSSLERRISNLPALQSLLEQVVLVETMLRFSRTNQAMAKAWLLGCLKPNRYGNCSVRNPIYDHILRQLLERLPSITPAPDLTETVERQPQVFQLPLRGRYRLESTLKRNIITHIYRAHDLQTQEWVVVKQLLATRGVDVIAWRRFQREAEALRRLEHPHIIRWVETFREGDYSYIVMEYINGGTLDSLLNREGRQSLETLLPIMLGVADALGYAHHLGIIHRDVKPSNILLTQDLSPRLADFGVAHFSDIGERLTAPYAIIGTPAYLAPEGYDNTFYTPSEDIWSLGVTLFEMLTGFLPFNGRTQEHLRHAVQNQPLPDLQTIRPDLPPALVSLVGQMLARDPLERPQDGWALKRELSAL